MKAEGKRRAIKLQIDWSLIGNGLAILFNTIKWPVTLILIALIVSPRYRAARFSFNLDYKLLLEYIDVLRWPLIVLLGLLMLKPHVPDIIDRLRKFGAGPVSGEFDPPQKQNTDAKEVEALTTQEESQKAADGKNDGANEDKSLEVQLTSDAAKLAYELVYGLIYGTQLSLLKRLYKNIPDGLSQDQLIDLYEAHRKSVPAPYPSFVHFIQFLIDNSLVLYDVTDLKYKITNAGVYFLLHLSNTNRYDEFKPF